MSLDAKDRAILYALELDARRSDTSIAKETRLSREVVAYRIKKLQEEGIIKKYHAIVNSMALGDVMHRTYVRFHNTAPQKEQEIITDFAKTCNWITRVRGSWDIGAMAFVKDNYVFKELIDELLEKHGRYIADVQTAIMTKLHHCKRSWLTTQEEAYDITLQYDGSVKTDETDRRIIEVLIRDARATYREIAEAVDVHELTVKERIKRLEEENVLLAYTTFLDMTKLDMRYYKLHFTLNDKSRQARRKMIAYAIAHPNIVYVVEGMGCDDIELEIQVIDADALYKIIDEYRSNFKSDIRNHEFMEYTQEFEFRYA